ncbi:MAG: FMN-binding protein [Peptoniphilaceae bacterium]|nr:FMN-binding protein [Peptoniphilaceae bacterium]MDY6085778.1 FMN-binding protein [Peptoniphilaceae bacterium]
MSFSLRKMHRAGVLFFACLCAVPVLAGCEKEATLKPGTYEATGQGYAEDQPIRLSVSIDESGAIYEIRILEHHETDEIGAKALDQLTEKAVADNTADVEAISGATRTSEGFRDAVRAALEQAKAAAESTEK